MWIHWNPFAFVKKSLKIIWDSWYILKSNLTKGRQLIPNGNPLGIHWNPSKLFENEMNINWKPMTMKETQEQTMEKKHDPVGIHYESLLISWYPLELIKKSLTIIWNPLKIIQNQLKIMEDKGGPVGIHEGFIQIHWNRWNLRRGHQKIAEIKWQSINKHWDSSETQGESIRNPLKSI